MAGPGASRRPNARRAPTIKHLIKPMNPSDNSFYGKFNFIPQLFMCHPNLELLRDPPRLVELSYFCPYNVDQPGTVVVLQY